MKLPKDLGPEYFFRYGPAPLFSPSPEVRLYKRHRYWFPTKLDSVIVLSKNDHETVESLIEWGAEELAERVRIKRRMNDEWKTIS